MKVKMDVKRIVVRRKLIYGPRLLVNYNFVCRLPTLKKSDDVDTSQWENKKSIKPKWQTCRMKPTRLDETHTVRPV